MTKYIILAILLIPFVNLAQNNLEWEDGYQLTVDDYLAKAPNTGTMQTVSGSFYVAYEMGGINLLTNRNLNSYVSCYFQKDASYIDDGDETSTKRLLRYQQLIFNLYELQARKLRQKFFEERTRLLTKGAGSLYNEVAAEHARLVSEIEGGTNHGYSSDETTEWLEWTDQELKKLADYCKECKPQKKKRKNN
ncbi:hypothetical protein OU798_10960 [Prolixibacteraceae bacterium Z1-6]|uniref:Uncharacterized protein n=1 Tax=Draconibacterium aestuarii TaxID=2998507 RepID=A0A9X3J6E0_9BACT|nr:hypothetical protein [Prolixibacteraceae bacterium Z1-6]